MRIAGARNILWLFCYRAGWSEDGTNWISSRLNSTGGELSCFFYGLHGYELMRVVTWQICVWSD